MPNIIPIKPFDMQSDLIDRVVDGGHVTFARYNDGEWHSIFGLEDGMRNADGHDFFPGMKDELIQTITEPGDYHYCMGGGKWYEKVSAWLLCQHIVFDWYDSNILYNHNYKGELGPFVNLLRQTRNVLVGPKRLAPIRNIFGLDHLHHVEVSTHNCYLAIRQIEFQLSEYLENNRDVLFVLFCAGMPSGIMIRDFWPFVKHKPGGLLDCGSLFDPYVNHRSRGVYRDMDWTDIIRRNLA